MALLLFAPPEETGRILIRRLRGQGDQVRVAIDASVSESTPEPDSWRRLGAHVARVEPDDPDFVMRAALGTRTAVVFNDEWHLSASRLEALQRGLREAGVSRIIVIGREIHELSIWTLEQNGSEYVALVTGKYRGFFRGWADVEPAAVAEAIDAADDLAGKPKLVLDLTTEQGWRELKLEPHIPR